MNIRKDVYMSSEICKLKHNTTYNHKPDYFFFLKKQKNNDSAGNILEKVEVLTISLGSFLVKPS